MNHKTAITFFILLLTLLIGFGIGFLSHGAWVRKRLEPVREVRTEEGFVQFMEGIMHLDEKQSNAVDSILRVYFRQMQISRQQHREQMKAKMDSLLHDITPHTSSQQREKLEKQRQQIRRFLGAPTRPHRKARDR